MSYITKEEEQMLRKIDQFVLRFLDMPRLPDEYKEAIEWYTSWIEDVSEYSDNMRQKSSAKIKEKRKENPRYARVSNEKQREYQKKYRAKKKEGDA